MKQTGMIKILIVDDHKMFRDGIRAILDQESDLQVTGEAGSARELYAAMEGALPDVILMDITLGDSNGIDLSKALLEKYPKIRILAVSMHLESTYILKMLENGVSGYILKEAGKSEMLNAIRAVAAGASYFSQQVSSMLVAHLQRKNAQPTRNKTEVLLTRREIEVLRMIASERSNQEIADQLYISIRTVDTHRRNLLQKLGLKNTAGLVKYAIKNGFLE
ncbi:MAG: response regulator transcription factor [Lewinellaceae bacterium]|nr:response regulator transcription factor [Lewinella sp.]MCB9281887.1 response regulator transcription factor [Lewinellaceae bacterium]